eukprot:196064_1
MNNILTTTISLLLIGESYGNLLQRLSSNSRKLLGDWGYELSYSTKLKVDYRIYDDAGNERKDKRDWLTPFSGEYEFIEIRNFKPAYKLTTCAIDSNYCRTGATLYADCLESGQLRWIFYHYDPTDDPSNGDAAVDTCKQYETTASACENWFSGRNPTIKNSGEHETYETNDITPHEVENKQECVAEGLNSDRNFRVEGPLVNEMNENSETSDSVTIWYMNKLCIDFGVENDELTSWSGDYIFAGIENNRPKYVMYKCKDENNCRWTALLQGSCVGPAGDESLRWQFIEEHSDNSIWGVWNMCKKYSTTPIECNNDDWMHRKPIISNCGDHNSYEADKNYNLAQNNECSA